MRQDGSCGVKAQWNDFVLCILFSFDILFMIAIAVIVIVTTAMLSVLFCSSTCTVQIDRPPQSFDMLAQSRPPVVP